MRLLEAKAENFQSYPTLHITYAAQGLSAIAGATGAGKSTLMDLAPWIMYGATGKDGAADDIRAWGQNGITRGQLTVSTPNGAFTITRVRGTSSQNDLYWTEESSDIPIRGKSIVETQQFLTERLGVSSELFLLGSYLHQFSKADMFFVAKAKDRREALESVVNNDFAILLSERASEERKRTKERLNQTNLSRAGLEGALCNLLATDRRLNRAKSEWEAEHSERLKRLQSSWISFDSDKASSIEQLTWQELQWETTRSAVLEQLQTQERLLEFDVYPDYHFDDNEQELNDRLRNALVCPECGGLNVGQEILDQLRAVRTAKSKNEIHKQKLSSISDRIETKRREINPYSIALVEVSDRQNPYKIQLDEAKRQVCPHDFQIADTKEELTKVQAELAATQAAQEALQHRVHSLTWLYDKSFDLRGIVMRRVVKEIQDKTNYYLERHFDAALRVLFECGQSDKLDVTITNNAHEAPFRALSGGERCMLKLAFSLSLMRAAQNKAGVSFNIVMLDEAMNGLSDDLKVKAFGLLQELANEYETVFCIDHSEQLNLHFSKKYEVTKVNGQSSIHES